MGFVFDNMTFLEFVIRKYLGPPDGITANWHCPLCNAEDASLETRRPDRKGRIKFGCLLCDFWGDEYDIVRHFEPGLTRELRRKRIQELKAKFNRDSPLQEALEEFFAAPDFNDWSCVIELANRHGVKASRLMDAIQSRLTIGTLLFGDPDAPPKPVADLLRVCVSGTNNRSKGT